MSKTIVFCADGTWCGPQSVTGQSVLDAPDVEDEIARTPVTNVVKLYANLAGGPIAGSTPSPVEAEKALIDGRGDVLQVAKYLHGVGDSANPINKLLGGVFGLGVIARIVRGYTYISRNYVAGDAIVISGFSRGAYTARALAGMIAKVGLLNSQVYDPTDKVEAYKLGIAAWARSRSFALEGKGLLNGIASHLLNLVEELIASPLPSNGLIANVPIKAVGVWDTVGSLGIPVYADSHRYDLFRFIDQDLNPLVENGFHAMAVDELRADFEVTRWNSRAGVREVWFVGAHTDVGGGHPENESGLSDCALAWMLGMLEGVGLIFSKPLEAKVVPQPVGSPIHQPWLQVPFVDLPKAPRRVAPTDALHTAVLQRWRADAGYRPQPLDFLNGRIDTCLVDATMAVA